jgi:hypothetical protein
MAVTAGRDAKRSQGDVITVPVEAGESIYSGTLVNVDTDGYAMPGADTLNHLFVGIAADTVTNSGADGAVDVAVYTEGTFELSFSGTATQAVLGDPAYVFDNNTVALIASITNDVLVGKIVEFIDASTVRVKI